MFQLWLPLQVPALDIGACPQIPRGLCHSRWQINVHLRWIWGIFLNISVSLEILVTSQTK